MRSLQSHKLKLPAASPLNINELSLAQGIALDVVKENIVKVDGKKFFTACPAKSENYYALWTRDAAFTIIACVESMDEELLTAAKDSLEILKENQTDYGRIPAYISLKDPTNLTVEFGGWGRIETLDSQMWYVLAAKKYFEVTEDRDFISNEYISSYKKALEFLNFRAVASDKNQLVDWPISAGWDDQMHRLHHVTSLESLRILAINSLIYLLKKSKAPEVVINQYTNQVEKIKKQVTGTLWLTPKNIEYLMSNDTDEYGPGYFSIYKDQVVKLVKDNPQNYEYFQSYLAPYKISPDHIGRFDTYANILAIHAGVADTQSRKKILNFINVNELQKPYPLRTLHNPIKMGDLDFSKFYETARNKPFSYQNGAIWPHITSMYFSILAEEDHVQLIMLVSELVKMVLQKDTNCEYTFSEFYQGDDGTPGKNSQQHQCWTAAGTYKSVSILLGSENTTFF